MNLENYWPRSLGHHKNGLVDTDSEYITVAHINKKDKNGYAGNILLSTALIPFNELSDVLNAVGGIGWQVESWGPEPIVDNDEEYSSSFWVRGMTGTDKKYETIVNSWDHNDKVVMLPDNVFLMMFGLIPRHLENDYTSWDDHRLPEHDIVKVKSVADYELDPKDIEAYIKIKRSYLEEYCYLRKVAAVHVFYEDRKSNGDQSIDKVLNGKKGQIFDLKGRQLSLANINDSLYEKEFQFSRVWGCSLALMPSLTPKESKLSLKWPDIDKPKHDSYFNEYAYIKDEVLVKYQNKPEFLIYPLSGEVSRSSWWTTCYNQRFSRNYLRVEIRKLYDGMPDQEVRHWNNYATPEAQAKEDLEEYGNMHIGARVSDMVNSYVDFIRELVGLFSTLGFHVTEEKLSKISDKMVQDGWWRKNELNELANVVPINSSKSDFLARCMNLCKLFEKLSESTLRKFLIEYGVDKEEMANFRSMKLLSVLFSLIQIAEDRGFTFNTDQTLILSELDFKALSDKPKALIVLNSFRQLSAHAQGSSSDKKLDDAMKYFSISKASTASGWGLAFDKVIDKLVNKLYEYTDIISRH